MAQTQQLGVRFSQILNKLRFSLLPQDAVDGTLVGLTPDTATEALCHCLLVEERERKGKERRTLIVLGTLTTIWTLMFLGSGCFAYAPFWFFFGGPLLIAVAIWISSRKAQPLRHNALIGLTGVIGKVRDITLLPDLVRASRSLDGKARSHEAAIEEAVHDTIARLLPRLTGPEVAALPPDVKSHLQHEATDSPRHTLMVALLLAFGSAKDPCFLGLATHLVQTHPDERIREAASEYLKDLSPTTP